MTTIPNPALDWRKSSKSGNDTSCVEVHRDLDGLRDSKNVAGPVLTIDAAALVAAVKSDRISR